MKLIDTHTHLYLDEFAPDGGGEAAVRRALAAGVEHMVFPNVDCGTIGPMEALADMFPGAVSCAMGLHPTEVQADWAEALARVEEHMEAQTAAGRRYVAVGEVGIDLYWDRTFREEQMRVFERQCRTAARLGLPVIIHCREGLAETLEVLRGVPGVRGVFHSFGGTEADVEAVRATGDFYFGINGIVTFKNSGLGAVLPVIGAGRVLLETDSPYLAPVPRRGRRNESAFLPYICAFVAGRLGIDAETAADMTAANARDLFGISAGRDSA